MSEDVRRQAKEFLYTEADLLDDWQLHDWLKLFTDDCRYWVPSNTDDYDPESQASLIYMDRIRLEDLVIRLLNSATHCQVPRSRTRRIIGNIRVQSKDEEELHVSSNFIICEVRLNRDRLLGGRCDHFLRIENGHWSIRMKKVTLVDNNVPLTNLSILL